MESPVKPDACVVCCRDIIFFSVGICDHSICHVCSTRLRVLCKQFDCPICRRDLPKVYFSSIKIPYSTASTWKKAPYNHNHKIGFEDERIQMQYSKLLDHSCLECPSKCSFRTFNYLKEHIRKTHEKFFCDLCVEHLRVFTFERKQYNRKDLATHRRIGDADDKSHKGHPLCEFCDIRFIDSDELYKHLRRDHFFCHFCDNDGGNQYYGDYDLLRKHFRSSHFLCEEADCHEEKFTSVFRSEIDYKAHKSQCHSKSMSKAQAKQTRTLEIEFAIAPRAKPQNGVITPADYTAIETTDFQPSRRNRNAASTNSSINKVSTISQKQERNPEPATASSFVNTRCENDFPTLSGSNSIFETYSQGNKSSNNQSLANKFASNNRFTVRNGILDDSNFPSLSSSGIEPTQAVPNYKPANGSKISAAKKLQVNLKKSEDFPSLKGNANSSKRLSNLATNLPIQVSHKAPVSRAPQQASNSNHVVSNFKSMSLQDPPPIFNDSGGKNFPSLPSKVKPSNSNRNVKEVHLSSAKAKNKKKGKQPTTSNENSDTETNPNNAIKDILPKKQESKKSPVHMKDVPSLGPPKVAYNAVKDALPKKQEFKKSPVHMEDFPSLGPTKAAPPPGFSTTISHNMASVPPGLIKPAPPGFIKPAPPGFIKPAPPGFVDDNKKVPSMMFTSSSGQDYPITSKTIEYSQPENFNERNKELIQTIKSVLKNNDEKFSIFKDVSSKFRKEHLSSELYFKKCMETFGKQNFEIVFAELLVLLPDISKQQQLLKVYNQFKANEDSQKGAKPKSGWTINKKFLICAACRQVLCENDFKNHMILHNLETNFPSLPNSKAEVNNCKTHITWKKKS